MKGWVLIGGYLVEDKKTYGVVPMKFRTFTIINNKITEIVDIIKSTGCNQHLFSEFFERIKLFKLLLIES